MSSYPFKLKTLSALIMSWNNHHTFPYYYLNINVLKIEPIINIKFVGMSSVDKNSTLDEKMDV